MPKIVTPLSLSQIKTAKPKDKVYKLSDGGGLALWVLPSGTKSWRLQYRRADGKMDTMTLGLFPRFGLADARAWRDEMLSKIKKHSFVFKIIVIKIWIFFFFWRNNSICWTNNSIIF